MLYESKLKSTMLDVLDNRISSIVSCILALLSEGYIPSKNKNIILSWSLVLIDAYNNIDVLTKEQHEKLDRLYNTILKL